MATNPDDEEDRQGVSFVGEAARLLGQIWREVGVDPAWCFTTYLTRCHARALDAVTPAEIRACAPYLALEAHACRPRIVVPVGRQPYGAITGREPRSRGPVAEHLLWAGQSVVVIPTYDPRYYLRLAPGDERNDVLRRMLDDWWVVLGVMEALGLAGASTTFTEGAF